MNAASSGTTSSAARYAADLPLWDELAATAAARCSTSAPAPAASRCASRAPATTVTALDLDAELLAALADRGRERGPPRRARSSPTPPTSTPATASRSSPCRCRRSSCCRTPPARLLRARARRALAPGGLVALAIADRARGRSRTPSCRRPTSASRDGWRFVSQPTAVRARRRRRRGSSACATRSRPDGERSTAQRRDRARRGQRRRARGRGRRRRPASPSRARYIEPTDDHVGSEVVLLRG